MIRGRGGGAADSGDEAPAWNPELGHSRGAPRSPLPPSTRRSKGAVSPTRIALVAILVLFAVFLLSVFLRDHQAATGAFKGDRAAQAAGNGLEPAAGGGVVAATPRRLPAGTAAAVSTRPAAAAVAGPARTRVVFTTRFGKFTMEIVPEEDMPLTVGAFMRNIRSGFYTGLVFHRAEPGFLIQAGGRTLKNKYRISKNHPVAEKEYKHPNVKYAVAMTSTGQEWFVNMGNNTDWLGPGSVFNGKTTSKSTGDPVVAHVVDGFDVMDQVQKLKADKKGVIRWIEEPVEFEDIEIEGEAPLPRWTGTP